MASSTSNYEQCFTTRIVRPPVGETDLTLAGTVALTGENCDVAGYDGTVSFAGPWAAAHDVAYNASIMGNHVVLVLDPVLYAATGAAALTSAAGIPARFRPTNNISISKIVTDSSANAQGMFSINATTGVVTVYRSIAAATFQAVGNCGWPATVLEYSIM